MWNNASKIAEIKGVNQAVNVLGIIFQKTYDYLSIFITKFSQCLHISSLQMILCPSLCLTQVHSSYQTHWEQHTQTIPSDKKKSGHA